MFFLGAMVGTLLGELLGYILPEGVVKQFFLQSAEFSLRSLGAENEAVSLDTGVFSLIFGFTIKLNFASMIGLAAAYYFLRYFR